MNKRLIYSLIGLFLIFSFGFIAISSSNYSREEGEEISEHIQPIDRISEKYMVGEVQKVLAEEENEVYNQKNISQELLVLIKTGEEKGDKVKISTGFIPINDKPKIAKEGEDIVIVKVEPVAGSVDTEPTYYIYDKYRIPSLIGIAIFFLLVITALARFKGIRSVLGLASSIFIIMKYILPEILEGKNPLIVTLIGGSLIAIISIYLAHGFKKRTTVALIGILATLLIVTIVGILAIDFSQLYGLSSETVFQLKVSEYQYINLKGLVLASIIISSLGILDDVASTQVATVEEIHKANKNLSFKELYKRSIKVGQEHITSMVNTLVLVFTGASLPMFLVFIADTTRPGWIITNTEMIAEEIVRSLVGSIGLALAVPITTFLAVYFFSLKNKKRD